MASKPLTLGIYYTNTSPLSTIIWPNFATKLCRPTEALVGIETSVAGWVDLGFDGP